MGRSLIIPLLIVIVFCAYHNSANDSILNCLYSSNLSQVTYIPKNSTYSSILKYSIKNGRFNTTATFKPSFIVTPDSIPQIQSTVKCSKSYDLQIRIRSGGHDFEGLSYTSSPQGISSSSSFLLLDLIRFRNITIDDHHSTAWVQAAVTAGELYYKLHEVSPTLAFPSGICPTIGLGGQISGGGYGTLVRKYGLSGDNVVDAQLIDAKGRFLDRASMGEDLFWAIRGGGGNTFGVVVAWKIKLVKVPANVTVCNVVKTLEQNATEIFHRWQYVIDKKLPNGVFSHVVLTSGQASFNTMFLGGIKSLIPIMDKKFPELGLKGENCVETSWAMSNLYLLGFPLDTPLESLLDRTTLSIGLANFKSKSDYVKDPIPISGLKGIWAKLKEVGAGRAALLMESFGGKMHQMSESSIPFPHRDAIYQVQETTLWAEDNEVVADRQINWVKELYNYMTPYVSKNPREAYVNYRDLDIGTNGDGGGSRWENYLMAKSWGLKYFKGNFDRLVDVKTAVDPDNFFRNEQSIPPL